MPDADRLGVSGSPGDGPYVKIWLKAKDGRITAATFETNGCPSSIACASMLCELAAGREIDKLGLIEANELIKILGGLPEGKEMYATLAVQALRTALKEE
jgi:NifU-like protein involved in Fe-S cluster formation